MVVKYGGAVLAGRRTGTGGGPTAPDPVLAAVARVVGAGARVALVHGGGPELSAWMGRLGKEAVFVGGLRVTDAETARLAQMVLAGLVGKDLAAALGALGIRAVAVCGKDAGLLRARRRAPVPGPDGLPVDLGFVGEVEAVDPWLLRLLLDGGAVPVVASVAGGPEGETLNVNADLAAAAVAGALAARWFVLLTDVPGLLLDPGDPDSLVPRLTWEEVERLTAAGTITGGMLPKVEACRRALAAGAREAVIADGRAPGFLGRILQGEEAVGTRILLR